MSIPKFIEQNAFNIMGIPTTAPISDTKKRSSHLISLSKIDETESYDSDLGNVNTLRKESELRKALERLTSVKDRLGETFFWYEIDTNEDQILYKKVTSGRYADAANEWLVLFERSGNWIAKKNAALSFCLLSFQEKSESIFAQCITAWREIWTSEEFWSFYVNHYTTHDDLGTSKDLFSEFRQKLGDHISRLTVEAFHQIGSPAVLGIFFSRFDQVGREIDENIISPVSKQLANCLDTLDLHANQEKCDVSGKTFSSAVEEVASLISRLSSFNLDSYTPVAVLKEKVAEKLRSVSIDLHNKHNDTVVSKKLLALGATLTTSKSYQAQAKKDQDQLHKNEVFEKEIVPKLLAVKDQSPEKRYDTLMGIIANSSNDIGSDFLSNLKRQYICEYAVDKFTKAKEKLLNKKKETQAATEFAAVHDLLKKHLGEFDLNADKVLSIVSDLSKEVLEVRDPQYLSQIDNRLKEIFDVGQKLELDDESKAAFIFLCQATVYRDIAPYMRRIRYGSYIVSLGWYTVWFYGIGAIFWIAGFLYKRKVF